MCRLAAYLGSRTTLTSFLLSPPHSLYKQSWAAAEMQDACVNADGFGLAWENDKAEILTYKSILPIWSDNNLVTLADNLESHLWLGNVRSATPGQALGEFNTQPFVDKNQVYLHNGFIKPFSNATKTALLEAIDNDLCARINGNTDSEYLFALIKQAERNKKDLFEAFKEAMETIIHCSGEINAMLTVIIYTEDCFYLCRHAINENCPSLYYSIDNNAFPDSIIIASEKLNDCNSWVTVPPHSLIKLSLQESPNLVSL